MLFVLLIILAVLGALVAIIGGAAMLGNAFRESIVWGLVYLFVPLGALIYLLTHWSDNSRWFLCNLVGALVFVGSLMTLGSTVDRSKWPWPSASAAAADSAPAVPAKATAELTQLREELAELENRIYVEQQALQQQYAALAKRRAALKEKDQKAVQSFNEEAKAYAARKQTFDSLRQQLQTKRAQQEKLVDSQVVVRKLPPPSAAPVAATSAAVAKTNDVVIYTTTRCPACVRAKTYLGSKGVAYREVNVEASRQNYEEFRRYGSSGVPVIVINGAAIHGFNAAAIDSALGMTM